MPTSRVVIDCDTGVDDALALAIAADRSLATRTRGMTVADLRPWAPNEAANARVVLEVDSASFIERWMGTLCGTKA